MAVSLTRPPRLDLSQSDRNEVLMAVAKGRPVEDASLAAFAVERSRWFTRVMAVSALVWCAVAGLFGLAAATSHKSVVWIFLFGWSLFLIAGMLLMRRRYARSLRANRVLVGA